LAHPLPTSHVDWWWWIICAVLSQFLPLFPHIVTPSIFNQSTPFLFWTISIHVYPSYNQRIAWFHWLYRKIYSFENVLFSRFFSLLHATRSIQLSSFSLLVFTICSNLVGYTLGTLFPFKNKLIMTSVVIYYLFSHVHIFVHFCTSNTSKLCFYVLHSTWILYLITLQTLVALLYHIIIHISYIIIINIS